ncbi:MAG: hypothetical protein ABI646_00910, partial [Acidobacteriota bacterium]
GPIAHPGRTRDARAIKLFKLLVIMAGIFVLAFVGGLATSGVTLKSLSSSRFEILGEMPGREMLLGIVGKFWKLGGELKKIDAVSFKEFETAGYAKAVWNFSVVEEGDDTRLTTETRIKCLDAESRKRFGFYWMFIRPFSGLIRMEMLRAIKRRAEMSVPPAVAGG